MHRVLCLHGFRTNRAIFQLQCRGLARELRKALAEGGEGAGGGVELELVMPDGTHAATGPGDPELPQEGNREWWGRWGGAAPAAAAAAGGVAGTGLDSGFDPARMPPAGAWEGWANAAEAMAADPPNGYLRGWLGPELDGLQAALEALEALADAAAARGEPIHAVCGFSQGAAVAWMLAQRQQARHAAMAAPMETGSMATATATAAAAAVAAWPTMARPWRWDYCLLFSGVVVDLEADADTRAAPAQASARQLLGGPHAGAVRGLPSLHAFDPGEMFARECQRLLQMFGGGGSGGGGGGGGQSSADGGADAGAVADADAGAGAGADEADAAAVLHHRAGHALPVDSAFFAPVVAFVRKHMRA